MRVWQDELRGLNMKKAIRHELNEEMQPEYDFSNGVRGKYFGLVTPETKVRITGKGGKKKITTLGALIGTHKPVKAANGRSSRSRPSSRRTNRAK